jgi:hypothetical protein
MRVIVTAGAFLALICEHLFVVVMDTRKAKLGAGLSIYFDKYEQSSLYLERYEP